MVPRVSGLRETPTNGTPGIIAISGVFSCPDSSGAHSHGAGMHSLLSGMDQNVWGWAWFALAVVTAGLAVQKNRSRLAWFIWSLILGPLATVLVVVWAPAAPGPVEPLHPFTDAGDRFAAFTPVLILVAFLCGVIAYAAQEPLVLIGIGACTVAFLALLVGALRARDSTGATDAR